MKVRFKVITDGDLTATRTKAKKAYICGACQCHILISEEHYKVHCLGDNRMLDSRIHSYCIGKVVKVPEPAPAKLPLVVVATNCSLCGQELVRLDWNKECYLKVCNNPKCDLIRRPQAKELKEKDDTW